MKRVLFFLTSILLTSCGILMNNTAGSDISSDRTYLSVEIIQTLSKNEALAWTSNYKVVKLETDSEIYYDGKKITGNFALTDTYSYTNKEGTIKTVPVYTRTNSIPDEYGEKRYLSVEIIQTLNKGEALAWTDDYKVVKLETSSEVFYDGKRITGNFSLVGTYSYTNKEGTRKTVPVYIRTTEYQKMIQQEI